MDGYEKWSAKPAPLRYNLNFVGAATGYLNGRITTITMQLYASSHADAMRMFNDSLATTTLVNLSDYHVCKHE